jgi:hypothetical protein
VSTFQSQDEMEPQGSLVRVIPIVYMMRVLSWCLILSLQGLPSVEAVLGDSLQSCGDSFYSDSEVNNQSRQFNSKD